MPRFSSSDPRRVTLSKALSHANLRNAWRATVRRGLRDQELPDLHDHLDVHWRIPQIVSRLHAEATEFTYRPRDPEIARLEKSQGITRRTVIPSPADAMVLQALVDAISTQVLRAQPTKTSFYTRSHQQRTMADVDATFPSDWLLLWKEGQRRIWKFTQVYNVLVVTDIANYFDAIPIGQLRNRIASLGHFDEVVLDFLFHLLAQLIWRPEYLPPSGTGLPQIQFDAPRLLAHAYLYEADRFLSRECNGDVVRWMDDITFGATDVATAKEVLRELDELLASLGIRLNSGKTKILSSRDGVKHFRMLENRYLSVVQEILDLRPNSPSTKSRVARYLRRSWAKFWRDPRSGFWEKIGKRFFTLFGRLNDSHLQRWVPEIIASVPSLRHSAFRYYRRLGYSRGRFNQIRDFIQGPHCLDDAGLFGGVTLLVDWSIPHNGVSARETVAVAMRLPRSATTPGVGFAAGLWLLAKYGTDMEIGDYAVRHERQWRISQWASRQVAAASVRMNGESAARVAGTISAFGLLEGAAVLGHIREIQHRTSLTKGMRMYIERPSQPFPLSKALIACTLLRGNLPERRKAQLLSRLLGAVADPTYERLLRIAAS